MPNYRKLLPSVNWQYTTVCNTLFHVPRPMRVLPENFSHSMPWGARQKWCISTATILYPQAQMQPLLLGADFGTYTFLTWKRIHVLCGIEHQKYECKKRNIFFPPFLWPYVGPHRKELMAKANGTIKYTSVNSKLWSSVVNSWPFLPKPLQALKREL